MNADEMFEKLGYERNEIEYENDIEIVEYRQTIRNDVFEKVVKIIELHNPKFYDYPFIRLSTILKSILRNDEFDLSMQELQAINKKCEELKWI